MKNEECDETTMLGRRKRAGSYVSQDTIYKREMQKRKKKSEEKFPLEEMLIFQTEAISMLNCTIK